MLECPRCGSTFYTAIHIVDKTFPILCFWCDNILSRTVVIYPVAEDNEEGELDVDEGK